MSTRCRDKMMTDDGNIKVKTSCNDEDGKDAKKSCLCLRLACLQFVAYLTVLLM